MPRAYHATRKAPCGISSVRIADHPLGALSVPVVAAFALLARRAVRDGYRWCPQSTLPTISALSGTVEICHHSGNQYHESALTQVSLNMGQRLYKPKREYAQENFLNDIVHCEQLERASRLRKASKTSAWESEPAMVSWPVPRRLRSSAELAPNTNWGNKRAVSVPEVCPVLFQELSETCKRLGDPI